MATENETQVVLKHLEEKVLSELKESHPYEALQYVQSFVARKKKVLGQNTTSLLVFHGAKLMVQHGANSSAGTLLAWYIEDGAGVDFIFKLQKNNLDADNFCDVERLNALLASITPVEASLIVDLIYAPFHLLVAKTRIPNGSALATRIRAAEVLFANIFDVSKRWLNAFKSYIRLEDTKKASNVVNQWSTEGYASEKGLFFARGLLQLLADGKVSLAGSFLIESAPKIEDNISVPNHKGGGADSAALAIWHFSTILTQLAVMAPVPRVDKKKLFGLLYQRYINLIIQVDTKLAELVVRIGELVFQVQMTQPAAPAINPMAMLQGLMGGGGGANGGGMDMGKMMDMMNKMQGGGGNGNGQRSLY